MAIIDPDGLFSGERLAACSDRAQLLWPRLFLGANGNARLELSYESIIAKIFSNFKKPPERKELLAIFREYQANFLAILYESNGRWWCQFITSEKFLPRYKTRRDEESPAPCLELIEKHQKGYIEWKKAKSMSPQLFPEFAENFVRRGVGIGVGIGVGDGVKTTGLTPSSDSNESDLSDPAKLEMRQWETDLTKRMFSFYCDAVNRDSRRYTLTEKRRKKAYLRIEERLKVHGGDRAKVEIEIVKAIENLAQSDYHRTNGYQDWENQIFRSEEEFEKRLNWSRPNGQPNRSEQVSNSIRDTINQRRANRAANVSVMPGTLQAHDERDGGTVLSGVDGGTKA